MELIDTAVIVTGGASGLGAATARAFAQQGAKVSIFDHQFDVAKKIAAEVGGLACACDVVDPDAVRACLEQASNRHGHARILVNCAGIGTAQRAVGKNGALPLESFTRVVNINLIGTFNVIRLFAEACFALDALENDERGVIINTASIAAFDGQVGQAAYSASKGGVVSMTLPLAREFAARGVRVNAIAPGIFETPLLHSAPPNVQMQLAELAPFPRRLGKPEEFAKLVLHIAENTMLNGETIRLDGAVRLN